jgi:DNA-binding MarR family transcriptional regulator
MRISELANNTILDSLTGPQIVVYLRLLGASHVQKSRRVRIINAALYRDARTARRVLDELEAMGLVKVVFGSTSIDRKIELAR